MTPPSIAAPAMDGARKLLRWAILALAVVIVLLAELAPAAAGDMRRLLGLVVILPVMFSAWLLNERGQLARAQLVLIYGFLAGVTFSIFFHGGLRAPLAIVYPIVIIAAGWLCTRTHFIAVAALCCLAVAGLTAAELLHYLPAYAPAAAAWQAAIYLGAFAAAATAVLYFRQRYLLRLEEVQSLAMHLAASESELRLVTQHVPAMLLRLDRDKRIRFANPALAAFLSRPAENLAGAALVPLFGAETGIALRDLADRVAATGEDTSLTLPHRPQGETETMLQAEAVAHRTAGGTIDGTLMLIRDVTEQHRAAAALEAQRRMHAALLQAQADAEIGLIAIENDRVVLANEVVRRLFGYGEAEIARDATPTVGRFLAMVDAPDRPRVVDNLANRLLGGAFEKRFDVGVHLPDGRHRTLEVTAAVMASVPAPRTLIMLTDVTGRRLAEARLRHFNEELDERVRARTAELDAANRDLEAFAYSVSHELRTPLRAIDGYSHVLLAEHGGGLDGEAPGLLEKIRKTAQFMGALIDDMLMLSDVSRAALKPARVDLSDLARKLLAELREAEPGREVEARIEDACVAFCDPGTARVLLKNLLGNAWKYTARTPGACIAFGKETRDGETVFRVTDNGAGFDMAHAGRLFTPFVRLHRPAEFVGTGIGLAAAARAAHRNNGRIWAEAAPGLGATFRFTLPARQ